MPNQEKRSKSVERETLFMRAKRENPSIYMGESGISLYERSKDHWAGFEAKSRDSHILKHWVTHHGRQGKPDIRLEVVKYCRDTLSRQGGRQ